MSFEPPFSFEVAADDAAEEQREDEEAEGEHDDEVGQAGGPRHAENNLCKTAI